jgi:hypothetical protein
VFNIYLPSIYIKIKTFLKLALLLLTGKGHKNVYSGPPNELISNPVRVVQHLDSETDRPVNFSNEGFD